MVTRLEKTLKLCMCLGQDWMFRYPEGGGGRGSGWPRGGGVPRGGSPAPPLTRDLPDGPEDVQLLGVQRRDVAPGIPAEPEPTVGGVGWWCRGLHPIAPSPPPPRPPRAHPSRPVMRKSRLPRILVQLTKVSMLLESTVWYLLPAPVPSQAAGRGGVCVPRAQPADPQTPPEHTSPPPHTLGAQPCAGLAHLQPVLLHFHLIVGAGAHAGALVHHEVVCGETLAVSPGPPTPDPPPPPRPARRPGSRGQLRTQMPPYWYLVSGLGSSWKVRRL